MPEIDRLTDSTEWIDLESVERERTPREIIEKGIRHHLVGLSLSNTVILPGELGFNRSRVAVHNWVQKADLQPADGEKYLATNKINAPTEHVTRSYGMRWRIETSFEDSKQDTGLGDCEMWTDEGASTDWHLLMATVSFVLILSQALWGRFA